MTIAALACAAGAAQAEIPTLNATCPTGIEVHVDQGGYGFINGKEAGLHIFNESSFDVRHGGITVSITLNPDGTALASYTRNTGANGVCEVEVYR